MPSIKFLILLLNRGEWSTPWPLYPWERTPVPTDPYHSEWCSTDIWGLNEKWSSVTSLQQFSSF